MNLRLKEAAQFLKLDSIPKIWEEIILEGCAIDSRLVRNGDLFVCLSGEKVDGHDFALMAEQKGAGAILAQKPLPNISIPVLVVPDVIKSLGALANYWRNKFSGTVIAVTGTAGKTTLKDMLVTVLSEKGKTAGSSKNNNNQIGLPCSMLNLGGDEKFWVLEAGISHAGDMDELGRIIEPDLAIIINSGAGHNEGLAEKGVAWNKARLLNYVKKDGSALISADYPELEHEVSNYPVEKLYFSTQKKADFQIVQSDWQLGEYTINAQGNSLKMKIPYSGVHFAEIAGFAAACALFFNIEPEKINKALAKAQLPEHRFKKIEHPAWNIYDDSYNANPMSMEKMLQSISQIAKNGKQPLILVLGEMKELGAAAGFWHEELGNFLAVTCADKIFWKGAFFEEIKKGYLKAGGANKLCFFTSEAEFRELFRNEDLQRGGTIFFKGSRTNKLENYLAIFLEILAAEN